MNSSWITNSILSQFYFFKPSHKPLLCTDKCTNKGRIKMRWYKEKRTERIEIRVEPALKELADDLARENNVSLSDYVRTFLVKEAKKYLKKIKD